METEKVIEKTGVGLLQGLGGFLCSIICIMGYYPLVPAFFAAGCLWKKRSYLFYVGLVLGIGCFMDLSAVVKYVILVTVIGIAIGFYKWANVRCSGITAGLIAGICTVAMNYSGSFLSWENRRELLLGGSEGIIVTGFTCLIHYLLGMLWDYRKSFVRSGVERKSMQPLPPVQSDVKMEALMSAVGGLSEVFSSLGKPREQEHMEDVGVIEQELAGKMCASCDGCAVCWNENRLDLSQNIREMIAAVINHDSREQIVEQKYVEKCRQYTDMVEEAIRVFGRMELNRAWYQRLLENRQVIAQQLDAMVELMGDWSKGERIVDDRSRMMLARIQFEVKERGLVTRNLHIYEDDQNRRYIRGYVSSKWGGGIPARNYCKALEKAMHQPMRLERGARSLITQEWTNITAYENTVFYTLPGIAMKRKDTSTITGDNFTMFDLDDGHHYIGLSDGMGSGIRASQESELVVDLLEKLLRAGFRKDIAIKMMNSAMVLQGENESFSTLDLASMDMYSGELELVKIGAASSFLKHRNDVRPLSADSLPAGADPTQRPGELRCTVEHGDFLVMVTDGVLEYLDVEEPQELFMELLRDIQTDNAGVLAKTLLAQVLEHTGGRAQDDMTILVTGIWERS